MGKKKIVYESDISKILKTIVWFFLSASFLIPLIYDIEAIFPFIAPRSFFFMATVQMAFFTWIVLAIKNANYRPKMEPITIAVSAFIGAMALSTIFSADPFFSFWSNYERMSGLLVYLHFFAFFLTLSSTIKRKEELIKLVGWVSVVASIVSLISLGHNLELIKLPPHFQNGSTLANTSFMASYLLVVLFFSLYGIVESQKIRRVFFGINFIIIASAIIFNPGGRAVKGAILVGMILFFLLYLAFTNRNRAIRIVSRFVLVVGLLAFLYISFFAFIEGSFVREKMEELHGMSARFVVWEIAWNGFRERPVLGWGPENFPLVFERGFDPQLRILDGGEILFDRAHNVVFDSLVIVGALGTFLFFAMFLTAVTLLWKGFFKKDGSDNGSDNGSGIWAPAVFTSFFVAHFIQNLTVFDMISSLMLVFASLAFASFLTSKREPSDDRELLPVAVPAIVASIFLTLTLNFFVILPYKANFSTAVVLMSPLEAPTTKYYKQALTNLIDRDATIIMVAKRLITSQSKNELRGQKRENVVQKMEYMIEVIEKAINREPKTFTKYWVAGKMYNEYYRYHFLRKIAESDSIQRNNYIEGAREAISRARELILSGMEISPRHQEIYWDLVQTEINMGIIYSMSGETELSKEKLREAFSLAEDAVRLEPRNIEAQINLILIARDVIRDQDLVMEKFNQALAVEPTWKPRLEAYIRREN